MAQPLIIKNWQRGIADSPHLGFSLMKAVDTESFPGAVRMQEKTFATAFHASHSSTFTVTAATEQFAIDNFSDAKKYTAVTITSTGTLPAGLLTGSTYFMAKITGSTGYFGVNLDEAIRGTTTLDITGTGTGTHTLTSVNPGTVNHIVKDPKTNYHFAHDSNGRVWVEAADITANRFYLLNGNLLTNASGKGLVSFVTGSAATSFLFAFRNAAIDAIPITGTSGVRVPVWSNAWQTLNTVSGSANSHHAIVGQDNIVYFCDDRYVGSLKEASGTTLVLATAGSYVYNNQALDMPQGEVANWLEELGTDLLIAGDTYNKVYPWDRTAASFNLPITVSENSIKKLKNTGNEVYIFAGVKGNIYKTQGSYARHFKKIPWSEVNPNGITGTTIVNWGGVGVQKDALIFGVEAVNNTDNSGLYTLYPDGRLFFDRSITTGSTNVTAIYTDGNDEQFVGYASGADYLGSTYAVNTSIIQSELYKVADKIGKATYSNLELQVRNPNVATGSANVSYRTDTGTAFTTLSNFVIQQGTTSVQADIGLIDIENIQIQIEPTGYVEINELRLT